MKKEIANGLIKYGLLIAMAALVVAQPAKAQSLQYGLKVNIPFDFTVGNKTLPAGRYSVNRAQLFSGDLLLQISNLNGNANTFRTTIPVTKLRAPNKSTLVFHRYGDQYFLSQVWAAGSQTGRALVQSRAERDLESKERDAKGLAVMKKVEVEVINIVADLP